MRLTKKGSTNPILLDDIEEFDKNTTIQDRNTQPYPKTEHTEKINHCKGDNNI